MAALGQLRSARQPVGNQLSRLSRRAKPTRSAQSSAPAASGRKSAPDAAIPPSGPRRPWFARRPAPRRFFRTASSVCADRRRPDCLGRVRAKAAVSSASSFRVVERLLRNRLLLERPQEIEIRHRREKKQVVGGGRDRVPPGRHLLVRNARLENGVREGELGRSRRESPAHRRPPHTFPSRLPTPSGWPRGSCHRCSAMARHG